jgi:hypothetical protein
MTIHVTIQRASRNCNYRELRGPIAQIQILLGGVGRTAIGEWTTGADIALDLSEIDSSTTVDAPAGSYDRFSIGSVDFVLGTTIVKGHYVAS